MYNVSMGLRTKIRTTKNKILNLSLILPNLGLEYKLIVHDYLKKIKK